MPGPETDTHLRIWISSSRQCPGGSCSSEVYMKITGVRTFPIETPAPHRGGRVWLVVRLDTDAGIRGYGELFLVGMIFRPRIILDMINDVVDQVLIGHDPYDIERLFTKIYDSFFSHYPEFTKLSILSALEMACWDIVGKDANRPVYRLMGGASRDRIRAYTVVYPDPGSAAGQSQSPEQVVDRALHYVDQGFSALKVDPFGADPGKEQAMGQITPIQYPHGELVRAERAIRMLREAVGDDCDIMIGTHGQMTASSAIRLARRLEQFDPMWFEEPVPPENVSEMAKVKHATTMPICTGERLTTKYDFARVIEHSAADIFNLDVGQVGGISEARKIASMAEANYLQIAPHVWGGPLIAAASIQLCATIPNLLIMESVERFEGPHAELLVPPITWRDGYVHPSDLPGLGHELDEDVAARLAPR